MSTMTLKQATAMVEASKQEVERRLQELTRPQRSIPTPRLLVKGRTIYTSGRKSSSR